MNNKTNREYLNNDYLLIPTTGSDLVAFDSNPNDYVNYVLDNYGKGWQYLRTDYWNDIKCLIWFKKINK